MSRGPLGAPFYLATGKERSTMRRKDREITDPARIGQILAGARYLHLGMHDGPFPYVVPLHYISVNQRVKVRMKDLKIS